MSAMGINNVSGYYTRNYVNAVFKEQIALDPNWEPVQVIAMKPAEITESVDSGKLMMDHTVLRREEMHRLEPLSLKLSALFSSKFSLIMGPSVKLEAPTMIFEGKEKLPECIIAEEKLYFNTDKMTIVGNLVIKIFPNTKVIMEAKEIELKGKVEVFVVSRDGDMIQEKLLLSTSSAKEMTDFFGRLHEAT